MFSAPLSPNLREKETWQKFLIHHPSGDVNIKGTIQYLDIASDN